MIKEIKAHLTKPYTEKEKIDFIVGNNHNKGYTIEELENGSLQAFEMIKTDEEKEQEERECRNQEIDEKIKELQIMALPEVLNGNIENIKLYNNVIDGLNKARL